MEAGDIAVDVIVGAVFVDAGDVVAVAVKALALGTARIKAGVVVDASDVVAVAVKKLVLLTRTQRLLAQFQDP